MIPADVRDALREQLVRYRDLTQALETVLSIYDEQSSTVPIDRVRIPQYEWLQKRLANGPMTTMELVKVALHEHRAKSRPGVHAILSKATSSGAITRVRTGLYSA